MLAEFDVVSYTIRQDISVWVYSMCVCMYVFAVNGKLVVTILPGETVVVCNGKTTSSLPEFLQATAWVLLQGGQQAQSQFLRMVEAEVELFQTRRVGVQSRGQESTASLGDSAKAQTSKQKIDISEHKF